MLGRPEGKWEARAVGALRFAIAVVLVAVVGGTARAQEPTPAGESLPFGDYLVRIDELQSASDAAVGHLGPTSSPTEVAAAFDEVMALATADLNDLREVAPASCCAAAHAEVLAYRASVIELTDAALPHIEGSQTLDEVFEVLGQVDVELRARHPVAYMEAPEASPGSAGASRNILAEMATCEPVASLPATPDDLAGLVPRELGEVPLTVRVLTGPEALAASDPAGARSFQDVLSDVGRTAEDVSIIQASTPDPTTAPAYVINAFHVDGVAGRDLFERMAQRVLEAAGLPPDFPIPLETISGRTVWPTYRGPGNEWIVQYPSGDLLVMAVGVGGLPLEEALPLLP